MGSCKSGGKGGTSANSNTKYNGFSVTDADGNTTDYVVINGIVDYAENRKYTTGIMGVSQLDNMQKMYDTFGSVQAMIDRVNQVGIGKATTLSDKDVEKKRGDYKKQRAKNEKQLNNLISGNKKSVNRKRNFWSAM